MREKCHHKVWITFLVCGRWELKPWPPASELATVPARPQPVTVVGDGLKRVFEPLAADHRSEAEKTNFCRTYFPNHDDDSPFKATFSLSLSHSLSLSFFLSLSFSWFMPQRWNFSIFPVENFIVRRILRSPGNGASSFVVGRVESTKVGSNFFSSSSSSVDGSRDLETFTTAQQPQQRRRWRQRRRRQQLTFSPQGWEQLTD